MLALDVGEPVGESVHCVQDNDCAWEKRIIAAFHAMQRLDVKSSLPHAVALVACVAV
ncbi:hypothetical protein ACDH50_13670 [Xanthomonas fragariae]